MSNNPTPPPPRIEREAFDYADSKRATMGYQDAYDGFKAGKSSEYTRAAPVVKALEMFLDIYGDKLLEDGKLNLKQILETYKSDV